ncbi:MAG: hypothetical protein ACK4IT_06925 [Thioalkalivibrionaceae bacterium]
MRLVVEEDDEKLTIKSHALRRKFDSAIGDSRYHFEAVINDARKARNSTIVCHIKYEDAEGSFLGLDKEVLYCSDDLDERYIEVAVDIPHGAEHVTVIVKEAKHASFMDRHEGLVIGGMAICVVAILIFAAKGLFGWQ